MDEPSVMGTENALMAAAGVAVASGFARGVDAAAHEAALGGPGGTIAVLGCGIDVDYPREHRRLKERLAEKHLLLSEHPPGTEPRPQNFPIRNRVIAGLSSGVVVVEASRRSGSLITARLAADFGRDVFAVPGSILSPFSTLPNQLIREGARVVTAAADILEELHLTAVVEERAAREALPADPTEAALLRLLSDEPMHVDDLTRGSKLPSSTKNCLVSLPWR